MKLRALSRYFRALDMFGETAAFTFEDGSKTYNTVGGAFLSIIVFCAILSHSLDKWEILTSFGDTNFQ